MGRSYRVPSYQLENQSLAASFNSERTNVLHKDRILYNLTWSNGSSLNGTIKVQFSNDDDENNATWYDLDFGSTISLTGTSGNHQILITMATFKYVRLSYTYTAGSGDLVAFIGMSAEGV